MGVNVAFEFRCHCAVSEGLANVAALLKENGVEFRIEQTSIKSTRVPIVLLGMDRRMYSKHNWVGINPFVYANAVEIGFVENSLGSVVHLRVDRTRSVIAFGIVSVSFAFIASVAPLGMLPVLGGILMAVFGALYYVSGTLIKREVKSVLGSKSSRWY